MENTLVLYQDRFTRRDLFSKASRFLFVVTIGTTSMAISCDNLFADIAAWIPTVGTAITNIVTLLGPLVPAPAAALIVLIKVALTDLAGAITEYQNDTNPTDKATLLAKIKTLLIDIYNNFQDFVALVSPTAGTVLNIVISLSSIILSAITGFIGQLGGTVVTQRTLKPVPAIYGKTLVVVPKYYKHVKDFKAEYNAACVKENHPEAELK